MSLWHGKALGGTSAGPEPDLVEVRAALAILIDPALAVQIQGLPTGRFRILRSDDADGQNAAIREFANDGGTYWTLNPLPLEMVGQQDKGAHANDPVKRRWLLIDVDRIKTEEDKSLSATDAEKAKAATITDGVLTWLNEQGWPAPLIVDSGNGWHLLYRIDLPNDELSRVILGRFLKALAVKFNNEHGEIDRKVHNANRVSKLPGTWARKGPPTPERPHRMAKLMSIPPALEAVTADQIQNAERLIVGKEPIREVPAESGGSIFNGKATGKIDRAKAYVLRAVELELGKVALCSNCRNNQLNESAFSIGTLLQTGYLNRADLETRLYDAACRCKLDQDDGGPGGVRATIQSGLNAGAVRPRTLPASLFDSPAPSESAKPKYDGNVLIIYRASAVTPRAVEWLWPGRIPLGKLTTFAGVGGLGKTFVLCDIAARVSRGLTWPCEGETCPPAVTGQVLFVSGEDDPDDTLVPRLIELGADLERIVFLKTEVQDQFTLADVPTLELAIAQAGPDVRFVAIDPPTAYLGGIDDHKNAELRGLLSPLKSWAQKGRLSCVFNTHVNKGTGAKVDAMMRVMGSVAWVNAVRAAHMFARDPDDPERRLMLPMKMNLAKERKGLAYQIVEANTLAKVAWLGEVEVTATDALNRESGKPRKIIASDWLIEAFQQKREWLSDELFKAGREAGVHRDAIFEAKSRLNLPRARRVTAEDGSIAYYWWVPEDWEHFPKPNPGPLEAETY